MAQRVKDMTAVAVDKTKGAVDGTARATKGAVDGTARATKATMNAASAYSNAALDYVPGVPRGDGPKHNIRGLQNFVADIRNCQNKEQEAKRVNKEMANIRSNFKEKSSKKNLSGYHRKKYIAKIMYMYMLGYEVDFGYVEAIRLLNEENFGEKQIGYLATQLMLTETHSMQPLIINSMQSDLNARSDLAQCLALTAIANIGSRDMADQVAAHVLNTLLAQSTKLTTKKKSAACLNHLILRNAEAVSLQDDHIDRILALCDPGIQYGFSLALSGLLLTLSRTMHDDFDNVSGKAVSILDKLTVNANTPRDYIYNGVSAPWLQVQLLRLVRTYPTPHDPVLRAALVNVLRRIISGAESAQVGSWNQKNARNMVLFEAIDTVIDLQPDEELVRQVSTVCCQFIEAKESNLRYLALEALAHITAVSPVIPPILHSHQEMVVSQLRDPDISIRRRALDLLYGLCDKTNVVQVVKELLEYLAAADYEIREDLAFKIAILAEKFASNYSWFVDVVLQLLLIAGDHVNSTVWHRVVRIVINHEDTQEYAAKTLFRAVCTKSAHETTVKVAAYLLGEFGHLIADFEGSRPLDQFRVLHAHMGRISPPTKALMLSTFDKFLNLYPEETEMTRCILEVLRASATCLDAELQQRAVEYLELARQPTLLAAVWDVMPPFADPKQDVEDSSRPSDARDDAALDAATTAALAAAQNNMGMGDLLGLSQPSAYGMTGAGRAAAPSSSAHAGSGSGASGSSSSAAAAAAAAPYAPNGSSPASPPAPQQVIHRQPTGMPTMQQPLSDPFGAAAVPQARTALSPKNLDAFNRLCLISDGVLYEDEYIQIGLRSAVQQSLARLMLYFGNTTAMPLTHVSSIVDVTDGLAVKAADIQPEIGAGVQAQQGIQIACMTPFKGTPTLTVSFTAGGQPVVIRLGLPLILSKFFAPLTLNRDQFFENWRQTVGPGLESVLVVRSNRTIDLTYVSKVLSTGFHLAVLENVDPNVNNLVASATFHSQSKQVMVMVRLESNKEAQMYRQTVRAQDPTVAADLAQLLAAQLGEIVPQQ